MSWLRKYPGFGVAWLALVLAVLAEGVALGVQVKAARSAAKFDSQVNRELRALMSRNPAPTRDTKEQIEADLQRAGAALAELRAALVAHGPIAERGLSAVAPVRRAEAFFDLAAFIEAMRLRARQSGVVVKADECFGFAAFSHEAPEAGRIGAVFRERMQAQYLVEALLDAQPVELLAVQREAPLPEAAQSSTSTPRVPPVALLPNRAAQDCFEMDRALSLRTPGSIDTTAFCLAFTGRTEVLRALLNRLAEYELPVVVRSVEASPFEEKVKHVSRASGETPPLIAPGLTRFCVTVEFVAVPPAIPTA